MRVLIVSAHPDDETLGCGGTILKHIYSGDEVCWCVFTKGFEPRWHKDVLQRKRDEVLAVSKAYGFKKLFMLDFPAAQLDKLNTSDIIDRFRQVMDEAVPEVIYVVSRTDIHTDHHIVFNTVVSSVKVFNISGVKKILCYETLSSTEIAPPFVERAFVPNVFSDITSQIDRKISIMQLFETEIQPAPFPRSLETIKALARYRGSVIGVEYAEAFMLVREVF